jgi:hypothetical protein
MTETDADLVEHGEAAFGVAGRGAGRAGRSPQRGRADGPVQSCRFRWDVPMVAGHVDGWRHVQHAAQGQTRRALQRHRGAFGLVQRRRRHAICRRRGQLPFNVCIDGLVAGRTGEAGCSGCSKRSSIRGFPGCAPIGDRRPGAVSVYDTGDHRIFGVAQVQSSDRTLSFTSQDGLVKVADLTKVAV